jgi:hypothetical protein
MSDSPKKSLDPSVMAALIGVAGTIIVTVISIYGNRTPAPPPTPVPPTAFFFTETVSPTPAPTDTVPAGESTSTPAPVTDTPEPTFTFTPVPPVPLGQDWTDGCISSLWMPYPSDILAVGGGNGCLLEPVHVFSADNGNMNFLYERDGNGATEVYGLFAPLPESGSITVKVHLKDLSNVDLLMGVFPEQNVDSKGLLLTIPSGNPNQRVIVQKEVPSYKTLQSTQNLSQGSGFSFTFTFNALSARGTLNPNVFVTNSVSIPSATKWLFLGYKGLTGSYRIEGEFFEFEIE